MWYFINFRTLHKAQCCHTSTCWFAVTSAYNNQQKSLVTWLLQYRTTSDVRLSPISSIWRLIFTHTPFRPYQCCPHSNCLRLSLTADTVNFANISIFYHQHYQHQNNDSSRWTTDNICPCWNICAFYQPTLLNSQTPALHNNSPHWMHSGSGCKITYMDDNEHHLAPCGISAILAPATNVTTYLHESAMIADMRHTCVLQTFVV